MTTDGSAAAGTPRLVGSAPVLLVRDVVAAEAYYRERLGFDPGRLQATRRTSVWSPVTG